MNYSKVCENARTLVQKTAKFIEREQKNRKDLGTISKGEHNFVTMVDKEAEKMLVNGLSKLIPESGFIAEEGTSDKKGDRYNWIIDPVDGTTNFIHGMAPYAISVALMDYNDIVVGIIYEIGAHECFYAWKGSPAYLNGKIIKVSDAPKVSDCLVGTGFPYTNFKYLDGFMKSVRYFMENSHGLRRLGSAATDIAYLACGRFDAFYEYGLKPWDVAAGVLILKQAGGRAGDFDGGSDYLFGEEIVASNSEVFDEFQSLIRKLIKG
jgi:myo-inositol-1(or 4)-monophosphatase